ncbi:MAG: tRNA (N6-isopentenyl adenosine(37)-C2)-methylthiotransferase MiaB [bacterium]|jgi:tRNA-2-methylthio-N6-dimethylallyladenosine synthase|nr:tRNA (N6-isopentenyl adenosine(37)-C2)-methylthiotransferase MiaB [candidate division KSB1 bacterium]MDH7558743.1 tRNA (N6-isopentenyl adenosine(37)-C2)-methylthiotransferase MiaB [bacterium]
MSDRERTYWIETYGCQMNKYDSELVAGILHAAGYQAAESLSAAEVVLVNTCSVRESAERRVRGRLNALRAPKSDGSCRVLGVIGCMADRLRERLLREHPAVDLVLGPDEYRRLPELLDEIFARRTVSVLRDASCTSETYAGIEPVRQPGVSAWVAIMRGCNNFCSYCVVPYVRGRERSRPVDSIVAEVERLIALGFVEVTLLGQNVNSYRDGGHDFADLLARVAQVPGLVRLRFATSHPKDLSTKLIQTIAAHGVICKHVHLPVQSGSNRVLRAMNRGYTREQYLRLVAELRSAMPEIALSTDVIVGFPGEEAADFAHTRWLLEEVRFDAAFLFKYSPREGTAACRLQETVSEDEKQARLEELIALQKQITLEKNRGRVGSVVEVLIEGPSKKSARQVMGRTGGNMIVVLQERYLSPGRLVQVLVTGAEGHTLFGKVVGRRSLAEAATEQG